MDVPQGNILSPALFNIKISNIVKSVLKVTDFSLFVDNFALCVRGKSLSRWKRSVQLCVNSVQTWIQESVFKFKNSMCTLLSTCGPLSWSRFRSGELRTQKLKSHLARTQNLNVLPLKPGVSQYSHTCYTYCQGFLPCLFLSFRSIPCIFPKSLPISPVLAVAHTWFLCRPAE